MYTVSVVPIGMMDFFLKQWSFSLFEDYLYMYVVSMLRKELRMNTLYIIIKLSTGIL